MTPPTRNTAAVVALFMFALGGCAEEGSATPTADKPTDGKSDAVSRLCQRARQPDDCDVCDVYQWYADGVCDDFCRTYDSDCSYVDGGSGGDAGGGWDSGDAGGDWDGGWSDGGGSDAGETCSPVVVSAPVIAACGNATRDCVGVATSQAEYDACLEADPHPTECRACQAQEVLACTTAAMCDYAYGQLLCCAAANCDVADEACIAMLCEVEVGAYQDCASSSGCTAATLDDCYP